VNGISDPRELAVGAELFIPGATRELEPPATAPKDDAELAPSSGPRPGPAQPRVAQAREVALRWPLQGMLYSKYGLRQGKRHDGIDIAAPEGSPVCAAADGTVVYAGQQEGYGEIVIVRHALDLLTVYAHAGAILVAQGARVLAGQPIARVGRSGRTTGPHLHFEVREGTRPRNPLLYLP
jgi:lipoprotein NlpD